MKKSVFITGVDTNIGKTFVSLGLALKLNLQGKKVGYYKPFQSGAYKKENQLIAPDIDEFREYSEIKTKYSYLFEGEVSPHLASHLQGIEVDFNKIENDFIAFSKNNDFTIIEGAGGLYCPTYKNKTFCDVAKALNQEIIIVTTPELGRLNHTLMTIDCAKKNNLFIKGIIINKMPIQKTLSEQNFIDELKMFCDIEILGVIPKIDKYTKTDILGAFSLISL